MSEQLQYNFTRGRFNRRDQFNSSKFNFLDNGQKTFFVPLGGLLQRAIDKAFNVAGGIIILDSGTHDFSNETITIPELTPIQFRGINATSTILDFGSTSGRFAIAGSGMYTTGTVSITSGVTVTGSSTSWLSSGLAVGDQIFLDSRWYSIDAITGDTTIILSEGYGGTALSGATYRAGSIAKDVEFNELTIKNSTNASGAIDADDVRNLLLEDVIFVSNNKNAVIKNFSEWNSNRTVSASATSDGFTFDTGTFCTNDNLSNVSNGGHGLVLTGVNKGYLFSSATDANTSDGINITSTKNFEIHLGESNGNGGQGVELVSGNENISLVNFDVIGNTSDGVKLTATSDECKIAMCRIKNNGAYGVNIAASTCDDTHIKDNKFSGNGTAASTDSGTGTLIRDNIGLADN